MSGFEVAGIVMGAVPLLVEALKAYQELGRRRDAFRRKRQHIGHMVRALDCQHVIVLTDVKIVCRNACVDDTKFEAHVRTGQLEKLLQRPGVKDSVASFLGDGFGVYLRILNDFEASLLTIVKSISLLDNELQTAGGSLAQLVPALQHGAPSGATVWKKLKFSMNREELDASIREIDELGQRLRTLRRQIQEGKQVAVSSVASTTCAVSSQLLAVQVRAGNLHRALAQAMEQACSREHDAWLYLEHRLGQQRAPASAAASKTVNFGLTLKNCASGSCMHCAVESLDTAIQAKAVDDVCRILGDCLSAKQELKLFHVDPERLHYQIDDSSSAAYQGFCYGRDRQIVTLRRMIEACRKKPRWHLKKRIELAVMISSSMLQLHATPWCKRLRSDSILFEQDAQGHIDVDRPFVACKLASARGVLSGRTHCGQTELLDLGVLILELWHGEAIQDFADRMGETLEENLDSRRRMARSWLQDTEGDMVTPVYEAALRCIECRFDAIKIDLLDHKLSQVILAGVIEPLWKNCSHSKD